MRLSIACTFLSVLTVALLLPEAEAWRFWRRVRWTRVAIAAGIAILGKRGQAADNDACPFTCRRYCPAGESCLVICANACTLKEGEKKDKNIKPFPHAFKTYDKDGDGSVTLEEFSDTLNADQESSATAFNFADDNDDGRLDEGEFNAAPYHKEDEENQEDDMQLGPEADE